jgi:Ca2+/Na+ antiporter
MKFFQNIKTNLILIVVLAIVVLLILNDFLAYALSIALVTFLVYWLWTVFVKKNQEEIEKLTTDLDKSKDEKEILEAENVELRNRKLNIAKLKDVLELNLMEIDTNFIRTWNDKFEFGNKTINFIGALEVRIIAKYGIDLKELRIKYDEDLRILTVANINPKFISFNDLNYTWKIAEVMEQKKPWLGVNHWRKSKMLDEFGSHLKEELRLKTHQEVKQGPKELTWIAQPLKKQIEDTLELVLGAPGKTIKIVDSFDDSYKALDEYMEV